MVRITACFARHEDQAGTSVPGGIVDFDWPAPDATPKIAAQQSEVEDPSFLAFSEATGTLYAVTENAREGQVFALRGGALSSQPTGGHAAVHLALDRSERFLAVANYRARPIGDDLSLSVFALKEDGSPGTRTASARHHGSGPDKARQERPHTHAVAFSPDNRLLVAVDLGTDGLWSYRFDPVAGKITLLGAFRLPEGTGPRHLAFHPTLPVLYVTGELNSTLLSVRYDPDKGPVALLHAAHATAARNVRRNFPSGVAIAPFGHHVLIANRGADTIASFWIDPVTGIARMKEEVNCGGAFPRALRFDPAGRFLAVANQKSGDLSLFGWDVADGRLSPAPLQQIGLAAPLDVIFTGA